MDRGLTRVLVLAAIVVMTAAFLPGVTLAETWKLVQEMSGPFDNPEGSVVGLDGSTVFVSNAKWDESLIDFVPGTGYITKLTIGSNGQLTEVTTGFTSPVLTKPWGMAVLPLSLDSVVPAGTVFVGHGDVLSTTGVGVTEIVAFDPSDGTQVGVIDLGTGSPFETVSGTTVKVINALAFDAEGNLYITDTGIVDRSAQGVWKVEASRLPDLLSVSPSSSTDGIWFIPLQGGPDGVEVSPDGKLYVNTVGQVVALGFNFGEIYDPYFGAIYNLTDAEFEAGCPDPLSASCRHVGYPLNPPLFEGLGALDGLVFTPGGTMLNTEILNTSDIVLINKPLKAAKFLGVTGLSGPADISVAKMGKKVYLIIPEHTSWGSVLPVNDQVTVIELKGVK